MRIRNRFVNGLYSSRRNHATAVLTRRSAPPGAAGAAVGQGKRRMTESKQLRLAIIGCGAISEQGHLPALKTLGYKPALLVDVDLPRTQRLAKQFRAAAVAPALKPEHFDAIDAAIVATPPLHHGPMCVELLRRGKHVLVEKPMTIA